MFRADTHEKGTQTETGEVEPASSLSAIGQDGLNMTEDASIFIKPILEIEQTVQELEQLVDAKSAEVAQLKLRVMLLEETDTDTAALRQQLSVAVREAQRWREKAEAAESKARIFQKFTSRIRSIHSSLAVGEGSLVSGEANGMVSLEGKDAEGAFRAHRVRFSGLGDGAGSSSITSNEAGPVAGGSTETEGEIVAEEADDDGRELTSPSTTSPFSSEPGALYPVAPGLPALQSLDGVVSPAAEAGQGAMDFSSAAMAMWVATQELLMMEEDEETSSPTPGISTVSTEGSFSDSFVAED